MTRFPIFLLNNKSSTERIRNRLYPCPIIISLYLSKLLFAWVLELLMNMFAWSVNYRFAVAYICFFFLFSSQHYFILFEFFSLFSCDGDIHNAMKGATLVKWTIPYIYCKRGNTIRKRGMFFFHLICIVRMDQKCLCKHLQETDFIFVCCCCFSRSVDCVYTL